MAITTTCRLGYLARPQAERLRDAGFRFTPHTLSLQGIAADILRVARELAEPSPLELVEAARILAASLSLVDEIEQVSFRLRPRQLERGAASQLRIEALAPVQSCLGRAEIQARHGAILNPMRTAPRDHARRVFRVALLGDIYSISEPCLNMNLEQQLGLLGVEVERWFWLSKSLRLPDLDRVRHRSENQAREEEVGRYLGREVGGSALPSPREAVTFVREGIDGLIHWPLSTAARKSWASVCSPDSPATTMCRSWLSPSTNTRAKPAWHNPPGGLCRSPRAAGQAPGATTEGGRLMRIGLPRALSYCEYAPLWRTFFEALGAQVVASQPTTRATLEVATTHATADLCFPAKVYVGHLLALADQVDLLFVPSLRRPVPAATRCAKIVGLPDLARSVLPDSSKLLEVDLDLDKGRLTLAQAVWAAGRPQTWYPIQIARAAEAAWEAYQPSRNRGMSFPERLTSAQHSSDTSECATGLTLAVVGHPYLLSDHYINRGLLRRLERLGARLLTPEALPAGAADRTVQDYSGNAYWAYAHSLLGAGLCFLQTETVDGLVAVIAFGCAPDRGFAPTLGQAARQAGVPMLTLALDEHSGEAGLVTRLEAFVDMLERKRRRR